MELATAEPDEYVEALQLLFSHHTPGEMSARVDAGLDLLSESSPERVRLFVARRGSVITAATLAEMIPGAIGIILPPMGPPTTCDALLAQVLQWLRSRGARLVQSVLADHDLVSADSLRRGGFRSPSSLVFLAATPRMIELPAEGFVANGPEWAVEFQETLLLSQSGGADFPELDGLRSPAEILETYRASSTNLACWWMLRVGPAFVGVVLLTPREDEVDLTYVGVVPESRRRGYGRTLVSKAMTEAWLNGARLLTVCVDSRNKPALALYDQLGFTEFDRRAAFLYVW